MTRVRTRILPKSYAKTETNHQRILMLDGYGQINVILIDNLDHFVDSLELRKHKQLAVEDILNANLVYSLAMQLNLNPGIYKEADDVIFAYIQSHISDDVVEEDKALLMQELKESWRRIHDHPLARRYIPLGDYQRIDRFLTEPPFAGFGGFAIFIQDYLSSLTLVCLQSHRMMPEPFCLLLDLVYSSFHGLNFYANPFGRQEHVIECLKWRGQHEPSEVLMRAKTHCEEALRRSKGTWFDRVRGAVQIYLQEVEIDFPAKAGLAIVKLLHLSEALSDDEALNAQLNQLLPFLRQETRALESFMRSVQFIEVKNEEALTISAEQSELFVQAVRYGVIDYANRQGIMLKPQREVPIIFWAAKGLAHEEKILTFLQEGENRFSLKNYELEALCKYAQHEVVKDLVIAEKRRRAQFTGLEGAVAAMSLASAFPAPLLFRPGLVSFPVHARRAPAPEVKFEDAVPEDENILTLKENSGLCAVM